MKPTTFYRQCILVRRPTPDVEIKTTSYIPEKYAKVGWTLQLKGKDDVWVDGWEVMQTGSLQPAEIVKGLAHNSGDIWTATSGPNPRGNK